MELISLSGATIAFIFYIAGIFSGIILTTLLIISVYIIPYVKSWKRFMYFLKEYREYREK